MPTRSSGGASAQQGAVLVAVLPARRSLQLRSCVAATRGSLERRALRGVIASNAA